MSVAASVLLPYQQRWVADTSPVKVAEKSRRIGLTWAEAADNALTAAKRKEAGGRDAWYVGYNQDMAREYIETVARWAKAFQLAADEIEAADDVLEDVDREKGIQAFRIRFHSGHKVVALSSRPSNLRGKQGDVVIDEAAFHHALGELLKAALALLIWGGRVRIISTHDGEENEYNELVNDVRAGRKPYSIHRITLDDALADGLYRRICERTGAAWSAAAEAEWRAALVAQYGEAADEELFCIPRTGGGAYLPGALIEARMQPGIPVVTYSQPASFAQQPTAIRELETSLWCEETLGPLLPRLHPNWLSYFGEDFGRSGDLTVIWPLQVRTDLVRVTPFLVELRNIPFEQQRQVLFWIVDRLPRFTAGKLDARGNGQYLAEVSMQRYGAGRIEMVMLSEPWYRDNFPKYKAGLEDGMLVLPRNSEVLADHRAVRLVRGVPRIPETARSGKGQAQRHGDSAVAGLLGYAATLADVVTYDYTPAAVASPFGERHPDEDDGGAGRLRFRPGGY